MAEAKERTCFALCIENKKEGRESESEPIVSSKREHNIATCKDLRATVARNEQYRNGIQRAHAAVYIQLVLFHSRIHIYFFKLWSGVSHFAFIQTENFALIDEPKHQEQAAASNEQRRSNPTPRAGHFNAVL